MGLKSSLPISRDSLKSGSHKAEFDCIILYVNCYITYFIISSLVLTQISDRQIGFEATDSSKLIVAVTCKLMHEGCQCFSCKKQLYKTLRPSVRPSVGPSVGLSVGRSVRRSVRRSVGYAFFFSNREIRGETAYKSQNQYRIRIMKHNLSPNH